LISISVCFWCGPVEVILQTEQTTSSATWHNLRRHPSLMTTFNELLFSQFLNS
jgi:hypothetical protein